MAELNAKSTAENWGVEYVDGYATSWPLTDTQIPVYDGAVASTMECTPVGFYWEASSRTLTIAADPNNAPSTYTKSVTFAKEAEIPYSQQLYYLLGILPQPFGYGKINHVVFADDIVVNRFAPEGYDCFITDIDTDCLLSIDIIGHVTIKEEAHNFLYSYNLQHDLANLDYRKLDLSACRTIFNITPFSSSDAALTTGEKYWFLTV